MTPVEAQACGSPVIAFSKGGALETVIEGVTGTFFDSQTPESLIDAVYRLDNMEIQKESCRKNAELFSTETFEKKMKSFIEKKWGEFSTNNQRNLCK